MDSLIPEEFVGRCVASADMMCATTTIYPDARGGIPLTAVELRRKYGVREQKIDEAKKSPISRLLRWFKKACGSPVIEI